MRTARAFLVAALGAVVACGGGGGGDGGGTGPAVFTLLNFTTPGPMLVGDTQTLTASARDQNGGSVTGATVTYTSGNQAVATVTPAGVVTAVSVGTATITATGTAGTVTKTATADVSVVVPQPTAGVSATVSNTFSPTKVFVTVGGVVTWTFATLHNVTFDTQGAPGNIADRATGNAALTFATAGTYPYHCTIHGASMSGTVVVK
jgi:plastocyanin